MDSLISAVASTIASKYSHTIYTDDIGEGFERPSFFIYRISDLDTPMNRWLYNTNAIVQIVYFSPIDDYENIVSKADQTATMQALKHAFMAAQGVKLDDGFAHLDKTNTDYTGDKDIFLQLTFDIMTTTRKEYDEAQNTELMNDINFNTKESD